jgi:hypothetical protein
MKNINDLREDQIAVYADLRSGKVGQSQAKELANVAGKILSSCKIQMEYNKMTGNNKKAIKFLEV